MSRDKDRRERDKLRRERDKLREEVARQRGNGGNRRPKGKTDRNPNNLRGLNVTAQPRKPAIRKAKIPVSDSVDAWSDLLAHPFTAPSAGVYAPISGDVVPCPSTKVRNYGTQTVTCIDSGQNVGMTGFCAWFWPAGRLGATAGEGTPLNGFTCSVNELEASASTYGTFGPMLNGPAPTLANRLGAAAGVWTPTNNVLQTHFTVPTNTSAQNPTIPFAWDDLINPFSVPEKPSDVQFKCTAFAVRVTFDGPLQNTEGWVDFYNPYAWTGNPGGISQSLASLRRDPSHRRCYFSNKRSFTFVWHPNCESSSYAQVYRTANAALGQTPARFIIEVGGLGQGDTIEVEYIGFQEFKGHPAVATNTPSPIAHDVVHVANAIPELRGKMNPGASEGPTSTLSQHVAASKLHEHSDVIGGAAKTVAATVAKHVKGPGSSVLGTLADIALPFLSFL